MNALEFLKQDHKSAMNLFDQIENAKTGGQKAKMELFNQLKSALTLHTKIEEQLFYPEIENNQETRDLVREAYKEHQEVDDLLSEISGLSPTTEEFTTKLEELRDAVEHHVSEEENEMFPKVRQIFKQDRLNEMGRQMQEIKQGKTATATSKRK